LLRANPDLTADIACGCLFFRDRAITERFRAGFRAGGMPEGSAAAKRSRRAPPTRADTELLATTSLISGNPHRYR
jgi:hypothetical protein